MRREDLASAPIPPDGRLARAVRNAQLDAHNARVLARIALETSAESECASPTAGATAGGDERKLRGIPAIARGVAGAVPGSSPHLVDLDRHAA